MNKNSIILGLAIVTFAITAIAETSNKDGNSNKEAKSIAWYTANVKEARSKNKECFENKELQATEGCENSLHALKLVYVGVGN
jgi:inner membrane protein involved in colicin E2 resistance